MMVVSLGFLFEALSIVLCLHYLYGEKPRLDAITITYIIIDVILMDVINLGQLGQIWTLLMYPIIILYCGLKFGFDIKAIFINNILYLIIIGIFQTTIMLVFSVLFMNHKMGAMDNCIINAVMLGLIIGGLRKCKLEKLSAILQSNEVLMVVSVTVVVISVLLL